MTQPPYSLRQVVTDGPLTAPRWLQHTVKVMTSLSLCFGLYALGVPLFLASILAGPGLVFALVVREAVWPSDSNHYPLYKHLADLLTDTSLAGVAVVAALQIEKGWRISLPIFVAFGITYLIAHHDARP